MVHTELKDQTRVITLRPNRSASWQETRLFLYLLSGTTLAIGILWAIAGIWAILPFSGIEAALIAYLMYRVCCATYQRQTITFCGERVLIQSGKDKPSHSWSLERASTRLFVQKTRHHPDRSTINLADDAQQVEIGGFLNKADKDHMLQELKQAGISLQSPA